MKLKRFAALCVALMMLAGPCALGEAALDGYQRVKAHIIVETVNDALEYFFSYCEDEDGCPQFTFGEAEDESVFVQYGDTGIVVDAGDGARKIEFETAHRALIVAVYRLAFGENGGALADYVLSDDFGLDAQAAQALLASELMRLEDVATQMGLIVKDELGATLDGTIEAAARVLGEYLRAIAQDEAALNALAELRVWGAFGVAQTDFKQHLLDLAEQASAFDTHTTNRVYARLGGDGAHEVLIAVEDDDEQLAFSLNLTDERLACEFTYAMRDNQPASIIAKLNAGEDAFEFKFESALPYMGETSIGVTFENGALDAFASKTNEGALVFDHSLSAAANGAKYLGEWINAYGEVAALNIAIEATDAGVSADAAYDLIDQSETGYVHNHSRLELGAQLDLSRIALTFEGVALSEYGEQDDLSKEAYYFGGEYADYALNAYLHNEVERVDAALTVTGADGAYGANLMVTGKSPDINGGAPFELITGDLALNLNRDTLPIYDFSLNAYNVIDGETALSVRSSRTIENGFAFDYSDSDENNIQIRAELVTKNIGKSIAYTGAVNDVPINGELGYELVQAQSRSKVSTLIKPYFTLNMIPYEGADEQRNALELPLTLTEFADGNQQAALEFIVTSDGDAETLLKAQAFITYEPLTARPAHVEGEPFTQDEMVDIIEAFLANQ